MMLLSTTHGVKGESPGRRGKQNKNSLDVYAKDRFKAMIHSTDNKDITRENIARKLSDLNTLGIIQSPDISALPKGSWIIEFPVTLVKPFISRDDNSFYIIENPVRKDKVFGVPFTSAMAWKGNLRWTMMKVHLVQNVKEPNRFAEIRFQHTLLFGTEKGMEDVSQSWAKYLNELCPDANGRYREKLKEKFDKENIPNLSGMLYFYPTFWDDIDLEVINPHNRKTKTGEKPIYLEVVPARSKGIFKLLYVPFYHLGRSLSNNGLKSKILRDLKDSVVGLKEMMFTYGFSAKKSLGYGIIKENWNKNESKLLIKDLSGIKRFSDFNKLQEIIKNLKGESIH